MGRLGASLTMVAVLASGAALPSVAHADGDLQLVLTDRWREVPASKRLRLSQQLTDELTELGNFIGAHFNALSDDILGLKFDGRRRQARIRLGTGEGELLRFRLDSDWHFAQGKARINARIDLGIGKHQWHFELPDMEMLPTAYRGERGVEVRLPLIERTW